MKKIGVVIQIFLLVGAWGLNADLSNLLMMSHIIEHPHSHSHDSDSATEDLGVQYVEKSIAHSHHGHDTNTDSESHDSGSQDSEPHEHKLSVSVGTSFILAQNAKLTFAIPQAKEIINTPFVFNFSPPDLSSLFRPPLA